MSSGSEHDHDERNLRERVNRLSHEKANLQFISDILTEISSSAGLDRTLDRLLMMLMNAVGGGNLSVYYEIEGQWHVHDIYGRKEQIDRLGDSVERALLTESHLNIPADSSDGSEVDTSPKLAGATWVFPLVLNDRAFGALKLEGMLFDYHESIRDQLSLLSKYIALVLSNEIQNYAALQSAYEDLKAKNVELQTEIEERSRADRENLRLAEHLRQSEKMRAIGQLAGGIAHDFNNLLTTILGYAQIIEERSADEIISIDIQEIRMAGERAAGLTRQLLTFSRKQPVELKIIDVNTLIRDISKMTMRLIGENIALQLDLRAVPSNISADKNQLEQIVLNLAVNARDAMPEGGLLSISTSTISGANPREKLLLVQVADTGCGMTPEIQKQIFEPFFTTKSLDKGTGLGLSTTYGIVTRFGGALEVESQPGAGSTFSITFPVLDGEPEPSALTGEGRRGRGGAERVFLVEDELGVRNMISSFLRGKGYLVTAQNSGRAALDYVAANPGFSPELMITDIVMPDLGGHELAAEISAMKPDVKILFISGYQGNENRNRGSNYLAKPFTPTDLADKIRELLD